MALTFLEFHGLLGKATLREGVMEPTVSERCQA